MVVVGDADIVVGADTAKFSGDIAMLGSAMLPVIASATVGIVGMAGALAGAGAALGVFGAVFAGTFKETQEQTKVFEDLRNKADAFGVAAKVAQASGDTKAQTEALKNQRNELEQLKIQMSLLSPEQRKAVEGYMGMKDSWKGFMDENKPATFGIMAQGFEIIRSSIGDLQPLFDVGAKAIARMLTAVEGWQRSGGLRSLVDYLSTQAAAALPKIGQLFVNLGTALGNVFGKIGAGGGGQGMLDWLVKITAAFANFTGGQAFTDFLEKTATNTPAVNAILGSLVQNVAVIAQALTPLAPISLAIAGALSALINAVPVPVITAIAGAFIAFSLAMKAHAAYTILSTAAIAAWNAVVAIARTATLLWATAMFILSATPVVAIIIAIVAAVALVVAAFVLAYKNSEAFRDIVNGAFGAVRDFIIMVWNAITGATAVAWNAITGAVTTATNAITGAVGAARDWIVAAFDTVRNWIIAAWAAVQAATATAWAAIQAAVQIVLAGITAAINAFKAGAVAAFEALQAAAVAVWNAIRTAATAVWNGIKELVSLAFAGMTTLANAFKTAAIAVWNAIKDGATTAWNTIKSIVTGAWDAVKSAATNAMNTVKDTVANGVNAVKDKFQEIKSAITNMDLTGAGKALIQGLINGIRGAIGGAVDAVQEGLGRIKSLLPGSPIKAGPLKSWNRGGAGKRLMGLVAEGIEAGAPQLRGAAVNAMGNVSNAFDKPTSSAGPAPSAPLITNIEVTIPMDDLERMTTVSAFVDMLGTARATSRQTQRSGKVALG